ncbi:hypothetical protein TNCV_1054911 [Trichonephila clavipes]|nr:hypothetical protein TNCV_1054911 [Trichonephila clavipes]
MNSCVMHHHTGRAPGTMFELLLWPHCSPDLSPIKTVWSTLAQRLPRDTPPAATPDQLWQYVEAAWTAESQRYIQTS